MAIDIINGYGAPRMNIVRLSDGLIYEEIDLDMCMIEAGLQEDYQEDFKRIELEYNGGFVDYDHRGSRITFTLDYVSLCSGANLLNLDKIEKYNTQPDTYKLIFMPRTILAGTRAFEVRCEGSFSSGIHTGSLSAIGMKGVRVSYVTTYPVSKNFYDMERDTIVINPFLII